MHIGLNILAGAQALSAEGIILPQLVTGPAVTGSGLEGTELSAGQGDVWSYDNAQATVASRQYRLLVGGVQAVSPQAAPALLLPAGSGGAAYDMQLRVQVTAAPALWSTWRSIASGLVQAVPVLAGASAAAEGPQGYAGTVTTDTGNGTLFWVVTTSTAAPGLASLKAGSSRPVAAAGPQPVTGTGLAAGGTYYLHAVQESAAGLDSNIASSAAFTAAEAPASDPGPFAPSDWTITDLAGGGDARITVLALPADGGDPLKSIEYRIGSGAWVPLALAVTGSFDLIGRFTDGVPTQVYLRATNLVGAGPDGQPKIVTTTAGATVPGQFGSADWSVADLGSGGDARVTLLALPATGGSPITAVQYRIGTGAWTALGGVAPGAYDLLNLFSDGVATQVRLRAVNAVGAGPESAARSVTTTAAATVPGQFGAGDWSIADLQTGGDARLTLAVLPATGGAALSALQYRIDSGAWQALGGIAAGAYDLLDRFTDGVPANVAVRAVNAVGPGAASATKPVTTSFVDVTAPLVNTIRLEGGRVIVDLTEASGTATAVWATADPGATPTFTLGGGWAGPRYQTGSFTVTAGGDQDTIPLTATTPAGARALTLQFHDAAGNLSPPSRVDFTMPDVTAPTLAARSPADNATGVAATAPLVLTFSEGMDRRGTVTLKLAGGATIQTFDLASAGTWSSVTAGDDRVTLVPSAAMPQGAALAVRWQGLQDRAGNPLPDNTGDTAWNFGTAAAPAPSITIAQRRSAGGDTTTLASFEMAAITIGAGTNRALVAAFSVVDTSNAALLGGTTARFGAAARAFGTGTPMTVLGPYNIGGMRTQVMFAVLVNPASGAGTVQLTFPETIGAVAGWYYELNGASQTPADYLAFGTGAQLATGIATSASVPEGILISALSLRSGDYSSEIAVATPAVLDGTISTGTSTASDVTGAFASQTGVASGSAGHAWSWTTIIDCEAATLSVRAQ